LKEIDMRLICILGLVFTAAAAAQSDSKKSDRAKDQTRLLDVWEAVLLQGQRAGHAHTWAERLERDGANVIRTTSSLKVTIKRNGKLIATGMDTGTVEKPDGQVHSTMP